MRIPAMRGDSVEVVYGKGKRRPAGPFEVEAQEKKRFPISPAEAGVMIAGGHILVIVGSSRR